MSESISDLAGSAARRKLTVLLFIWVAMAACAAGKQPPGESESGFQGVRVSRLPVALNGAWELRLEASDWQRELALKEGRWIPVAVPGPWERSAAPRHDGYASYRTRIILPPRLQGQMLGLRLSRVHDAYRVLWNGREIGGAGAPPPDYVTARIMEKVHPIAPDLIRAGDWNQLEVKVFNLAQAGGFVGPAPELGTYAELKAAETRADHVMVAFAVLFVIVGAHQVFFYLFVRHPAAHASLLLGLFSAASSLYLLTYVPGLEAWGIEPAVQYRANLVLLPVCIGLLGWFLFAFFEHEPPLLVKAVMVGLAVCAADAALFAHRHETFTFPLVVLGTALLAVAVGWFLLRVLRQRVAHSLLLAPAAATLAVAGLYDLASSRGVVPAAEIGVGGLVLPLGFVPFYLVLGLILGHRFRIYYQGATVDRLTGLMQRHLFLDRLADEMERVERVGGTVVVALLDLDEFKRINDTFGHGAGDQTLRSTSQLLRSRLRRFDLVGRYGGDELCLAMVMRRASEARPSLERIRSAIAGQRLDIAGREVRITASIGAVLYAGDLVTTPPRLLELADEALLEAKRAGRNQVVISEGLGAAMAEVVVTRSS